MLISPNTMPAPKPFVWTKSAEAKLDAALYYLFHSVH
jgi:hypothetical protein